MTARSALIIAALFSAPPAFADERELARLSVASDLLVAVWADMRCPGVALVGDVADRLADEYAITPRAFEGRGDLHDGSAAHVVSLDAAAADLGLAAMCGRMLDRFDGGPTDGLLTLRKPTAVAAARSLVAGQ